MKHDNNIPRHIAIIMDGNGRWAQEKGLPRSQGHKRGVKRVKEVIRAASDFGVKIVTLFAFSTENWKRPKHEIQVIMYALSSFLDREIEEFHENNFRLKVIGSKDNLPGSLLEKIRKAENKTSGNTGLTVVLAFNYGARQEIIEAIKKFTSEVVNKKADIDSLTQETFREYLYTYGLDDPDLLIRTSGEMRISNFLLWQLSYSELYFSEKCWPEFGRDDLEEAIKNYQQRKRRFGGIK